MRRWPVGAGVLALSCASAWAAVDVVALWDFDRPDVSEQRFRTALATAKGDDTLVLTTQIARTYGLRRDFTRARATLASIENAIVTAGPEAQARYWLELGRTYASATADASTQDERDKARARADFQRAYDIARQAQRDDLAIDALHMFAFVDTAPADQVAWDRKALAIAATSSQPAARRWEASLRNNLGYALHELGRYEEALGEFEKALGLRRARGDVEATWSAQWMVAWTLRALHRDDEALAQQLVLARERDAAGRPAADVFEELEILYRAKGDDREADRQATRRRALPAEETPR